MIALLLMSNLVVAPAGPPLPSAAPGMVTNVYVSSPTPRCPEARLSQALATDDLVYREWDRKDARPRPLAEEPPATPCLTRGAR